MSQADNFKFLSRDQVDTQRWDECIRASQHGLIYGYSFFLDRMAGNWSALVSEQYDWVLPVTSRTKWGISYLYQPAFTQQLGVFPINKEVVPWADIVHALQRKFSFWEVNWNDGIINPGFNGIDSKAATNFIIDLSAGYDRIVAGYHHDLEKNLKRSQRFSMTCQPVTDFNRLIRLYQDLYAGRMPHVTNEDYKHFASVCHYACAHDMLVCREVVDDQDGILATALLLRDDKRLYNMMNTTTSAGRKMEANHFLIDSIIREFAGQHLLLDFEGSDLPGVRSFYENFGATNQPYFQLKFNNLPWYIRWLKK